MNQTTVADLTPLATLLAQLLIAVLAAVATWAAAWVKKRANIAANSDMSHQLDGLLAEAVSFAQGHLMTLLGHADFTKVETRNAALQIGLSFVGSQAPGIIGSLGLTDQHLSDLLLAKMAKLDPTLVLPGSVILPSRQPATESPAPTVAASGAAGDSVAPLPPSAPQSPQLSAVPPVAANIGSA